MNKTPSVVHVFVFGIIIYIIFKLWFYPVLVMGGDLSHFYPEMIKNIPLMPYAWDFQRGSGLGGYYAPFLWNHFIITVPFLLIGKLTAFNWTILERVIFLYPFLIISCCSSYLFAKKLFKDSAYALLSSILYTTNTYILMVVGGGQMQIGLAYAMAPFVFLIYISLINNFIEKRNSTFFLALIAGLLVSLQVMFDIRIAYVTMLGIGGYFFYGLASVLKMKPRVRMFPYLLYALFIPLFSIIFINAFWIIPVIVKGGNPVQNLGDTFLRDVAVQYFSFAKLEYSFSLLHPNWFHNIFGKVDFMKSGFLTIPLLAYASLFFVNVEKTAAKQKETKYIVYLSLLGIFGSFLAKGTNPPFGDVYLFLFHVVPGFQLFRDPTKFYLLISFSYSLLIPLTLKNLQTIELPFFKKRSAHKKIFMSLLFSFLLLFYLFFLLKPAIQGNLSGTFKSTSLPEDYIKLKNFLVSDNAYYRTLWVPTVQKFAFYSSNHPAIGGEGFFKVNSSSAVINKLKNRNANILLQELSVRYVIVPFDAEKELFMRDRKYDEKLYKNTIQNLGKISWLKPVSNFGSIKVFEVKNPKDHFWFADGNNSFKWKQITPTHYQLLAKNGKINGRIIFSESFDPNWNASSMDIITPSEIYNGMFNSFRIVNATQVDITYTNQRWVWIGMVISILTCITIFILLILSRRKEYGQSL